MLSNLNDSYPALTETNWEKILVLRDALSPSIVYSPNTMYHVVNLDTWRWKVASTWKYVFFRSFIPIRIFFVLLLVVPSMISSIGFMVSSSYLAIYSGFPQEITDFYCSFFNDEIPLRSYYHISNLRFFVFISMNLNLFFISIP